jgi:hypothetical protein
VTGATGFIGRHLVAALHQAGFRLRLLLRREPDVPEWRGLPAPEVVAGALDDEAARERLVEGADVVIHLAGLIKAARRADFFASIATGHGDSAVDASPNAPNVVSAWRARPQLSGFAASKRASEAPSGPRAREACCIPRSSRRATADLMFTACGRPARHFARRRQARAAMSVVDLVPDGRDGARLWPRRCARPPTIACRATPGKRCSARRREP